MIDSTRPSTTALATSVMRAVHTRCDSPAVIDDSWGDVLVTDEERRAVCEAALKSLPPERRHGIERLPPDERLIAAARAVPTYATTILRTRVAEDALAAAVRRGVRQYVLVGAGIDSFAMRRPGFARRVAVYEVDHPATQRLKRARLAERGIVGAVEYVAADLAQEPLGAALARSSFDATRPAFFNWLGVSSYLTREENFETLKAIASCGAPGSEIVLSYLDEGGPETADEIARMRAAVAFLGEPWRSAYSPRELAEQLVQAGLAPVEDLGPRELTARYCTERDDGFAPAGYERIARARV